MSIESVMPSSHLILCRPLLLLPPIPPSITVFSNESTDTLPYVKLIASGNLLYDMGIPKSVLCDNLEGWDGEGGGRRAQGVGDIGIPLADSC